MDFFVYLIGLWLVASLWLGRKGDRTVRIRIALLVAMVLCCLVTLDLGYNYISNLSAASGALATRGVSAALLFGKGSATIDIFFKAFLISFLVTAVITMAYSFTGKAKRR